MRLLSESCSLAACCGVGRQSTGGRFGVVADSVAKTQDRFRGVLAIPRSKEQTVCQIDSDRTSVGNDVA